MTELEVDRLAPPTPEDLRRINVLLRQVGGEHVVWGAQQVLDVLLVEHQLAAQRRSSEKLERASWVLVAATLALVLATVGLIIATVAQK